jgi:hypothetical protein
MFSIRVVPLVFMLGASTTMHAQLGKPVILSPIGPSPQFPLFSWTQVEGATQYKLTIHTVTEIVRGNGRATEITGGDVSSIVDASVRCSHKKCGVQAPSYEDGVKPYLGAYIHIPRDDNGNLIVFTWKVEALKPGVAGSESAPASYTLAVSPPSPPRPTPPPPSQTSYTVTCVFQAGANYWAWYNGVFAPLINTSGQTAPGIFDKPITFSSTPLEKCDLVNGATPIATAKFVVNNVALCTNLTTGAQETFINLTCPQGNSSPPTYALTAFAEAVQAATTERSARLDVTGIGRIEFVPPTLDPAKQTGEGCADPANPSVKKPVGSTYCLNPTGLPNDGETFACKSDGFWWNTHSKCT